MTKELDEALEALKAVLCDPEGVVCINGSDEDRRVIQNALAALSFSPVVNARLVEAATKAAKTFRWYEQLHRAKPDHEKADRNKEFAEELEAALDAAIRKVRANDD